MEQEDHLPVSSFVLRFYALEKNSEGRDHFPWRVKVTHVQDGCQSSFCSIEDAVRYMNEVLGEWQK